MIFLNLFWMCSVTYYTLLYHKKATPDTSKVEEHQTQNMNIIATCGDAFFILHDWIFTEQIFNVSISIPIVINMFKTEEDLKADAEKALRTRWIVNIVFYLFTFAWFVISATTGKY